MSKGRLFIVSGPSGSGKDTILVKLFKLCPDIKFSISSITRAMRDCEKPGEKYNFISREQFKKMIADDEFLEYNEFVGNYYGTPKAPVLNAVNGGCDIIVEVDVNGASQIRKAMPESTSIFILPPDLATLKSRLCGRGTDSEDKIKQRLESALKEIERATEYDYVIVNRDADVAAAELAAVIRTDSFKTDRNFELIKEILKNER